MVFDLSIELFALRYILHGIINEVKDLREKFTVLLVIHLQFSSGHYIGFPCAPWRSVHIDTISPLQGQPILIKRMRGRSIYDIVKTEVEEETGILPVVPLIESLVPKAASLIKGGDPERSVLRIDKFLQAFRENAVFRQITLQKLVELLQCRDSRSEDSEAWLSRVSLYSNKLKEGSTYQAAVWARLQDSLAPLLAVILANIDCNSNLDLITSPDRWRVELFLQLYKTTSYDLTLLRTEDIPLLRSGPKEFKVKLPFSWSLIQTVQMIPSEAQLEEVANHSPSIRHLQQAMAVGGFQLVEDFVSDLLYTNISVPSPVNGMLVQKWLISEILRNSGREQAEGSADPDQHENEKALISPKLIDSVFNQLKENIGWFNQLTVSYPNIVNDVMDSVKGDIIETPLSEIALKFAIKTLTPDWERFEEEEVRAAWKKKVHHLQSVAQQMKSGAGEEAEAGMWRDWTRCVVFLNFIQNVLTPDMDSQLKLTVCKRLKTVWMTLKDPDLKKHSSFIKLVQILKNINRVAARVHYTGGVSECIKCQEVPSHPVGLPCGHVACRDCLADFFAQRKDKRCPSQKCKSPNLPGDFEIQTTLDLTEAVRNHNNFRKNLNVFFLDILKNFCFAADEEPPEKKILESLLEFVTLKSINGAGDGAAVRTKELSPFDEHGIDDNPTIRSFLLQLCLQSDQGFSNELISQLMVYKQTQLAPGDEEEMLELVHLYLNCVEDTAVRGRGRGLVLNAPLHWSEDTDLADLDSLNQLAQYKVGLEKLAETIVSYFEKTRDVNQAAQQINTARKCLAKSPEEFKTFLVKEICFKHRADVIPEMKKEEMFELLPELLLQNEDDVEDIFNIAGSLYPKMKELLRRFFVNNNHDELENFLENNDQPGILVLILGLYSKVISSIGEDLSEESVTTLIQAVQRFSTVPLGPIFQAGKLTGFPQRDVDLLKIAYLTRTVSSLNHTTGGLAEFFSSLVRTPESLQNKFLPSMPHDVKFQVLQTAMRDGRANSGQMKYK